MSFVAGTPEAKDAILETHIPQTAKIDRSTATVSVAYDGKPKFEQIQGTTMHYAVNTSYSVIRVENMYYCCHNAVWYHSASPSGTWAVSVSVPKVIYTVPPSCPVYNVKYVYVYDSTPTVVYVGYTPGYVGCYAYHGTVVYGTGHHYSAWHGAVYCARPATWGFSVAYNSHTGNWAFRAGYAGPAGRVAVGGVHIHGFDTHGGGRGWWGAGGYRHASANRFNNSFNRNVNVNNNINVNQNNIYARGDTARTRVDGRGGTRAAKAQDRGRVDTRGDRSAQTRRGSADRRGASSKTRRSNDVLADRNGNTYRKSLDGWQQRQGKEWSKPSWSNERSSGAKKAQGRTGSTGARSKSKGSSGQRRSTSGSGAYSAQRDLNRHSQARQRGASRSQGSQRSRSSGGRRGGGGRR